MPDFAEPLARLINEFKRLPGIGQKSAQRLAFHVLRASREDAEQLGQALLDVKDKLGLCRVCNNISDGELCVFCRDPNRDQKVLCVVEEAPNILGIESRLVDTDDDTSQDLFAATWMLVTSPANGFDKFIMDGSTEINPGRRIRPWTDDYSNLFQILKRSEEHTSELQSLRHLV